MTQPLALVLYEKLLPGTQLVNRLQDLKYRVQSVSDAALLAACAEQEKPIVIFVDLGIASGGVHEAIGQLKRSAETKHIPIIAFGTAAAVESLEAEKSGADVAVNEAAVLNHLPQLLEEALRVE